MIKKIDVYASGIKVGTIALLNNKNTAFQYSKEWLQTGFSINPFKLPLTHEVFVADKPYFGGLFGVFADSLPDSFGELLLDRYLRSKGIDVNSMNSLERLSYIGSSGMGLLEYVPSQSEENIIDSMDFDAIQKACNDLLSSKQVQDIDHLYHLGGSSGGARPKSLIRYKGEDWIVKFSSRYDPSNIGELEYRYMSLAKKFGIQIPDIELVTSNSGNKYFLIKRFDRQKDKRIHMISVAGLLECNFRTPCLDYDDLIKLTRALTQNEDDVIEMFRRMAFNVLADNQDDHAKNFSFLYDADVRLYRLAPAYDITPEKTYYGEHTTSVNGKGKDISDDDMIALAKKHKIKIALARSIIESCHRLLES